MQSAPVCGFCGISASEEADLMKCSGCLITYYCSKVHQCYDWKKHKPVCRAYQMKPPKAESGSNDSQLGASIKSDQSFSELESESSKRYQSSTSSLASTNGEDDNFALPMPVSSSGYRASVIQSTTRVEKGLTLPLITASARRKTLDTGELTHTWNKNGQRHYSVGQSQHSLLHKQVSAKRRNNDDSPEEVQVYKSIAIETVDHSLNHVINLATDPRFRSDVSSSSRHASFVQRLRNIAQVVASSLRAYGWCALDHFLGANHAGAILNEVQSLYSIPGKFEEGQLMRTKEGTVLSDIRSDKIYWFDNRIDQGVNVGFFISMTDSIVYHLSGQIPPYKINGRSRAMIGCYPGCGTKYVKHVDNPDKDGRCISALYYVNRNWTRNAGGVLRLHPENSLTPVDIEPLFDRLLFFWSDRRNPHEVLQSYDMRYAITIWYFDEEERAQAIARQRTEARSSEGSVMFSLPSRTNLETHMTRVALNESPQYSSSESLATTMSSTSSIPCLVNGDGRSSRAGDSLDEYTVRRATLDLGHFARN